MIASAIAWWWLGQGQKYRWSRNLAEKVRPGAWDARFSQVLAANGITLNDVNDKHSLAEKFRGKVNWRPDPLGGLWDTVTPPLLFLEAKGDDCDGTGMFMAQAIDYAFGYLGWQGQIVSVFCRPFRYSHHFAVGRDPSGRLHPVQPYPSAQQPADQDVIWPRTHLTYDAAAIDVIETSYPAQALALDVRDGMWDPVKGQAWRRVAR